MELTGKLEIKEKYFSTSFHISKTLEQSKNKCSSVSGCEWQKLQIFDSIYFIL